MKNISSIVLPFLMSSIIGCQSTGVYLTETPLNLSETRKMISTVIGMPRSVSENGRELLSRYYDSKERFLEKDEFPAHRIYTRVEIMGDRRPYDIEVDVIIEKREQGNEYFVEEHDDHRADIVAQKIQKALHQSRDKRNIIDDFRSF
jgi:hypothetical protein